jgi:hypothetical protein
VAGGLEWGGPRRDGSEVVGCGERRCKEKGRALGWPRLAPVSRRASEPLFTPRLFTPAAAHPPLVSGWEGLHNAIGGDWRACGWGPGGGL